MTLHSSFFNSCVFAVCDDLSICLLFFASDRWNDFDLNRVAFFRLRDNYRVFLRGCDCEDCNCYKDCTCYESCEDCYREREMPRLRTWRWFLNRLIASIRLIEFNSNRIESLSDSISKVEINISIRFQTWNRKLNRKIDLNLQDISSIINYNKSI